MPTFLREFRYALRGLANRPGFAAVIILTLALGIGANTAIFTAVDRALLRPLPYRDPGRLALIFETHPVLGNVQAPYQDYLDWRSQSRSFDDMAAYTFRGLQTMNLSGEGEPQQLQASFVTANLLPMLGVTPVIGRGFSESEQKPGFDRVVLLSHALWTERFGGDRGILERSIRLNAETFRVIGVLPPQGAYPNWADILLPVSRIGEYDLTSRKHHPLQVIGHLRSGVSIEQAQTEMAGIAQRLASTYPVTNNTIGARVIALNQEVTGDVRKPLLVMLAAVGLILLIACANVANLLLARGAARQKEITIRAALGAGRARLVQQFLAESLVLAIAGGVAGWMLATWAEPVLRTLAPAGMSSAETGIDLRVLAYTAAVTLLTGLLFGLLPAWRASRPNLDQWLRAGRISDHGAMRGSVRDLLVGLEVAMAVMVLIAAGLLIRSFGALIHVDPGFRPDHLLTVRISLPGTKYTKLEQFVTFYQGLLSRVNALPGVKGAAFADSLPLSGTPNWTRFAIEGQPRPQPGQMPIAQGHSVTPTYFQTLGIPLRAGRFFRDSDMNQLFVIINESTARKFFAGQDPVGRRILMGSVDVSPTPVPILGVVGDTRELGLNKNAEPELYFPGNSGRGVLMVRTSGDPLTLASAVRSAVVAVDPEQPVSNIQTLDQVLATSLSRQRFAMLLLTLFSGLGLALAAVGLYGVLSYSVAQRGPEMGVRIALGAGRWDIFGLVLRQGMHAAGFGVFVGVVAALFLSRAMGSLLFGVSVADPLTYLSVCALVTAVALLAIYIPARRAIQSDPALALRAE